MNREKADVLVVGSGMSGLCAAIAASDAGANVLVIEKGNRTGGSMMLSGGLIWTFADKAQLREEIPDGNAVLQDMVVDGLVEGHDWLLKRGVKLERRKTFQWYGHGRVAAPPQMATALADHLEKRSGRIMLTTGMERLVLDVAGRIAGVVAIQNEEALQIDARSVVLASGGFQGNPDLVARYVTPHAASMYLRANPWSTGDGFLAATAAGAATTSSLNTFYGHALVAPPARFSHFEFLGATQRYGPVAVALNLEGKRFTDESAGTGEETLNVAVARQSQATAVYILDDAIARRTLLNGTVPIAAIERAEAFGGPVLRTNTLDELARAMARWGLPSEAALKTLQSYNTAVRDSRATRIFPPRVKDAAPLETGPFIAVLVRAGITFTGGGLQTDMDMQVLRRAATASSMPMVIADIDELQLTPLPNLFAAGCDVGGINTSGYLGGLATALVTGRVAGAGAARNAGAIRS